MATELALQLAARVEKVHPPTADEIGAAAALATIALLDDERSRPGGEWHDAVEAWNGARIRKLVRRGRGAAWDRVQPVPGVTVERGRAQVRAFVPGPVDDVPPEVAKLQIQSTALDDGEPADPGPHDLVIAVTPEVELTWGKQAAQCAHAGQRAWMTSPTSVRQDWDGAGRPVTVVHPEPDQWSAVVARSQIQIRDGGFTEIPAGTLTAVAWFAGAEPRVPGWLARIRTWLGVRSA